MEKKKKKKEKTYAYRSLYYSNQILLKDYFLQKSK